MKPISTKASVAVLIWDLDSPTLRINTSSPASFSLGTAKTRRCGPCLPAKNSPSFTQFSKIRRLPRRFRI